MLNKKISAYYLLLAGILGAVVSAGVLKFANKQADEQTVVPVLAQEPQQDCEYTISRLEGYKNIQPVYLAERKCESNSFSGLKSNIVDFIESVKPSGELEYASVYLKDMHTNEWMDVNPDNTYRPGSLFKVITMTTFLKMAETNLSILEKVVDCPRGMTPPTQTFNSKTIEPGAKYKIKELIYYMIVYSDNNATMLLHKYMDTGLFLKIFSDLGLQKPDIYDNKYQLSVKEYSKFISVLFDGSYLSMPASEFAISLLCESDFTQGLTKELPKTLKVAHKFGEAGKPGNRELHESAIIYLNNKPYLLTIMTRGKDSRQLADILSHISRMVYDHMAGKAV